MSFEFGTKADYEKGIFQTTWTWWPEDTLDMIDMLLHYLGVNDTLVRPKVYNQIRKDSQVKALLHRAIYDKAVTSAQILVSPGRVSCKERRQMCWYVTPTRRTRERLAIAGIDSKTCLVSDQRRWAFAWQQVSTGNKMTYNSVLQEELVNSAFPTPQVAPVVKHVVVSFAKGRPSKVQYQYEKKNNFVWKDGEKTYDPKAAAVLEQERAAASGPPL